MTGQSDFEKSSLVIAQSSLVEVGGAKAFDTHNLSDVVNGRWRISVLAAAH
jgi:hypothetical protein